MTRYEQIEDFKYVILEGQDSVLKIRDLEDDITIFGSQKELFQHFSALCLHAPMKSRCKRHKNFLLFPNKISSSNYILAKKVFYVKDPLALEHKWNISYF